MSIRSLLIKPGLSVPAGVFIQAIIQMRHPEGLTILTKAREKEHPFKTLRPSIIQEQTAVALIRNIRDTGLRMKVIPRSRAATVLSLLPEKEEVAILQVPEAAAQVVVPQGAAVVPRVVVTRVRHPGRVHPVAQVHPVVLRVVHPVGQAQGNRRGSKKEIMNYEL